MYHDYPSLQSSSNGSQALTYSPSDDVFSQASSVQSLVSTPENGSHTHSAQKKSPQGVPAGQLTSDESLSLQSDFSTCLNHPTNDSTSLQQSPNLDAEQSCLADSEDVIVIAGLPPSATPNGLLAVIRSAIKASKGPPCELQIVDWKKEKAKVRLSRFQGSQRCTLILQDCLVVIVSLSLQL